MIGKGLDGNKLICINCIKKIFEGIYIYEALKRLNTHQNVLPNSLEI